MSLPPFQAFLDEHRTTVHRFLLAAAGPQEADDCFQETFTSALRAYPRLRPGSDLRAWVLTIAHRKAMDAHRARRRSPVPVEEVPEAPARTADRPGAAQVDGAHPELWTAVRDLPERQRAAVYLRFVGDLSHREIGRALQCSEPAARRSLHEGLTKLREEWDA